MQIHVVQSGQTLYGIARTYGISVADLSAANQINPIQTLVIGQALVIPISGICIILCSRGILFTKSADDSASTI